MTAECTWLFFCGAPGPAVMGQLDLKQKVTGFLVLEVAKGIQFKTIMIYHFTSIRITKIKKLTTTNVDEIVEQL